MKKITLLLLLSIIYMVLPSCSSDNDKNEPDNPSDNKIELLLIGEWSRNESGAAYYRIVFLDKGKGYDKVMYGSRYDIDETFTYTVKGSTLTIYWEGSDTDVYTVVNVTAKELILRYEDEFVSFTRI